MKNETAFLAFLEEAAESAKKALHLAEWKISFVRKARIVPHKHIPQEGGYAFEVESDHTYMIATISASHVALRQFQEGKLKDLKACIHHELAHIWTDPLYGFAWEKSSKKEEQKVIDLVENLTEKIAQLSL